MQRQNLKTDNSDLKKQNENNDSGNKVSEQKQF